jgi:hypothetical protein
MDELYVYSIDPGTVNCAVKRVSVALDPTTKTDYYGIKFDWFRQLTIKYPTIPEDEKGDDQDDDMVTTQKKSKKLTWKPKKLNKSVARNADQMIVAYAEELKQGEDLRIMREEIAQALKAYPHRPINILMEPQIDHLKSGRADNHNIYVSTIATLVTMYGSHNLRFIRWSGKNKSGLEGVTGKDRKIKTAPIAIEILKQEGFKRHARFIEELPKPKPQEDAADSYLQGRNYLLHVLALMGYTIPDESKGPADNCKRRRKRVKDHFMPDLPIEKPRDPDENNNNAENGFLQESEADDKEAELHKPSKKKRKRSERKKRDQDGESEPVDKPKTKKRKLAPPADESPTASTPTIPELRRNTVLNLVDSDNDQ